MARGRQRHAEVRTIDLAGVTYNFRTPKLALILSAFMAMKGKSEQEAYPILIEAQLKWVKRGVGNEAWADIEQRLADEEDDLDLTDIAQVFQDAMGSDAARPTTSSSVSSPPTPTTTSSEAKPSPPESMFGI